MKLAPAPNKADPNDFTWLEWFKDLRNNVNTTNSIVRKATDPSVADIPTDGWAIYKNTTNGQISLWVNDAGTMVRIFAFALAV